MLSFFCLLSCSDRYIDSEPISEEIVPNGYVNVNFLPKGLDIVKTRSSVSDAGLYGSYIIDEQEGMVNNYRFCLAEEDLSIPLKLGSHKAYLISTKSKVTDLDTNEKMLTFYDVDDTYFWSGDIEVKPYMGNIEAEVKRMNYKLSFILSDKIPANATSVSVLITIYYNKLNITGGTFEAINGGTNSVYSEDFTAFITGGTFNSDVVNYIANTYVVNENNGTYAVIENKVLETDDKKVTLESEKALDNTYTLEIEELGKEAKEEASKKVEETYIDNKEIKDTTLIKIYDIRIMKDREVISIENGKFTIAIAIPESDQKYDNYKVVYFDEEGKLVETLDAKLVNGKLVFTTTHLSTYGLVGNNNIVTEVVPEIIENPKTADINLALILALLGLSSVGTVLIITKKLVNENL